MGLMRVIVQRVMIFGGYMDEMRSYLEEEELKLMNMRIGQVEKNEKGDV